MPAIIVSDRIIKFKNEDGYIEFERQRIDYSVLSEQEGHLVVKVGESIKEIVYKEDEDAITIFQNGTVTVFQLSSDRDLLLRRFSNETMSQHHHTEVRAPMPGLVVDVMVRKGDKVKRGKTLVILEAMKMENEIRVSHDSEVADIFAMVGDVVEKDQVIATLK